MHSTLRKIVWIFLALCGLAAVYLCISNAKTNSKFWEINITNGFTIIWAIVFSFLVTQLFNRQQKKTDIIVRLFMELQDEISEDKTCKFSESSKVNEIHMNNRLIGQRIALLKEYAGRFGIKKDVDFLADKFKEYEEFISNHINDMSYLSKSYDELARPIKLMSNRIYIAVLKL